MNLTMLKTTLREIKHSLGRFISIMCIIALGVGFFAGLKTAKSDMLKTANTYLSDNSFFDYKLINTLGMDEDSVLAAQNNKNTAIAEGAYSVDSVMHFDNKDIAVKIHSVTDKLNKLCVTFGRTAKADGECVADKRYFGKGSIGKKITVSDDNENDVKDHLKSRTYSIVGVADSPMYLNYERGTTSLLDGTVDAFIYLPKSAFDMDYYSELYLCLNEKYEIFSSEYKSYISSVEKDIKALSETISDKRFTAVTNTALDKFEVNYNKYEQNYDKYEDEKTAAYDKLRNAKKKLDESSSTLSKKRAEYESGIKEYDKNKAAYDDEKKQLDDGIMQVNGGIDKAQDGILQLKASIAQYEAAPMLDEASKAILAALKMQLDEANKKLSELNNKKQQLMTQSETLKQQEQKLTAAKVKLDEGKIKLDEGLAELEKGKSEYASSKVKADSEFAKAKAELDEAKTKLDKAKAKIDDIAYPDSYTLGRDTNVGYVCFENDSGIVDGLAEVFPVFFFLVAALMCMTTMTRMVDEQRTDIGVMKALGYSKAVIMGKYISYSGLAAVFGCVLGFFGGSWLFPQAIWTAYKIMYGFAPLKIIYNPITAAGLLVVALICTIGATVLSCYSELNQNAAQIMRPKTPKSGKHTFFEKLAIFKRLGFLKKVSIRNLVRYKRRFIMMVLGIAGCTALLMTGFGIRDSIQKIGDYQYGEIMQFDYEVTFSKGYSKDKQAEFMKNAKYSGDIIFVHSASYDISLESGTKTAYVVATDNKNISSFVNLCYGKAAVEYPKDGSAVVTRKFAESNGISVGSKIAIVDSNMKKTELVVSGICDNYVYNYVYTTLASCKDGFGYLPEVKTAFINAKNGDDVHETAAKLMKEDNVRNVSVSADIRSRVAKMLGSLDYIVMLVIVCAGALAFVVLYNLTNINITERIREIATIKVLGFYPKEVSGYVFGENFVLTGIGAFFGIFLGKALHAFVMSKINIDMVSFNIRITLLSIALSIVLTFVFAVIVDFFMYFKLQKIDMAQSLKSIE